MISQKEVREIDTANSCCIMQPCPVQHPKQTHPSHSNAFFVETPSTPSLRSFAPQSRMLVRYDPEHSLHIVIHRRLVGRSSWGGRFGSIREVGELESGEVDVSFGTTRSSPQAFRCEEIDSIVKSKGPPEGQDKPPCSTAISIL
jgi:hypothetical protein